MPAVRRGWWWCDGRGGWPRTLVHVSVCWYTGAWAFGIRPGSARRGGAIDLFNAAILWGRRDDR